MEEGSSSLQLAFEVDEKPNPSKRVDIVDAFGRERTLYEVSYLCYGETEIIRRAHAELVFVRKASLFLFA